MAAKDPPIAVVTFEVAERADLTNLPLGPEEGFLLSRLVGRRATIADLARETGFAPTKVKGLLDGMRAKGAVSIDAAPAKAAPPTKQKDPYEGTIFSPADLADGKDLNDEQKKRILFIEGNLEDWTHYKLLEVRRSASPAEIKTAYLRLSKEFHPDACFRRDVGKYKDRVDRIFRALKAANDVLQKPVTRAAYDDTLVGELSEEELEELAAIADVKRREQEKKARLERAEAARKQSRLKWNPLTQRLAKAREMFKLAEEARKAGRLEEAATHARLATTYDEALKVRAEPILLEAEAAKAQHMIKRLQSAIQYGDKSMEQDIKRVAEEAAQMAEQTKRPGLLVDVAQVMLQANLPQRAFRLATVATEADDKLVAAWRILALAASAEEKWALASRAADRWLALEPASAEAKKLSKLAKDSRAASKA